MFHPRHLILILAVSSILGLLFGCGDGEGPGEPRPKGNEIKSSKERIVSPDVPRAELRSQVSANAAFGWDLYQQLRDGAGNLFYSPHSISMALAMLHAGARGNTARELASTLHFDLPQSQLHPVFNALDQQLQSRGNNAKAADGTAFRLKVVNAIWGQKDHSFLPSYLDTLAVNYGAGLRLQDFASTPEASRKTINDWVAEQTEDRIKDLLPAGSINSLTRLVLTNAIYFNAAWSTPFEKNQTADADFTLNDGSKKTVPTMNGLIPGSHAALQDAQAIRLPYDGFELAMTIVLPDAGKFAAVEARLGNALFDEIGEKLNNAELTLSLPKFEYSARLKLRETLRAMGIKDAFTSQVCDLSGIDGTNELYITDALHKAFVKVDEAGTEAAAATGIIAGTTSIPQPVTVKVDRPFIFVITDLGTGAVLFVGRVMDPAA